MDNAQALRVLHEHLKSWRDRTWDELRARIGESHHCDIASESGTRYQVEVQVLWDDKPDGAIRVIGSIDDGDWRAFAPLTDSFILAPDGSFFGE